MPPKLKDQKPHIHQYIKFKSRPGWYRCASPICTHYAERELVVGKMSICNSCGREFILTMEDCKRVRPMCLLCSDTKLARTHRNAMTLAQSLIPDVVEPLDGPDDEIKHVAENI